MRKIPTLFQREFDRHKVVQILNDVAPEMEWVLNGEGIATIKCDGSCCAIIDGIFYKRYDAKHGKKVPADAIPCEKAPDPVTGHLPCWRPCRKEDPDDKWFWAAYDHCAWEKTDRTYEAIGSHFLNNPYGLFEEVDYTPKLAADILLFVPNRFRYPAKCWAAKIEKLVEYREQEGNSGMVGGWLMHHQPFLPVMTDIGFTP